MSKPTELPTCRSLPQNHFQTLPNFLPVSTSKMAGEHQKKSIIARASILYYSHLFCVCSDVDGIYRDRSQAWIKSLSRGFHLSCGLHYTTKTGKECFSFGSSLNLPLREGTRVENLRTFRGRLYQTACRRRLFLHEEIADIFTQDRVYVLSCCKRCLTLILMQHTALNLSEPCRHSYLSCMVENRELKQGRRRLQ